MTLFVSNWDITYKKLIVKLAQQFQNKAGESYLPYDSFGENDQLQVLNSFYTYWIERRQKRILPRRWPLYIFHISEEQ